MPELVILASTGTESRAVLTGNEQVIGRDPTADIAIVDPKASRRHARIYEQNGSYWIEDLGSANGISIAGNRVNGPVEIAPGIQVQLGDSQLTVSQTDTAPHTDAGLTLRGLNAPYLGRVFSLPPGGGSVGRVEGNEIVLADASVSRRHATLTVSDGRLAVEDLGSSNGTFIDGNRIKQGLVVPGTRVRFGNIELEMVSDQRPPLVVIRDQWARFCQLDRRIRWAAGAGVALLLLFTITVIALAGGSDSGSLQQSYFASIDEAISQGRQAEAESDWGAARDAFAKALAADPINADARRGIASAERRLRDTETLTLAEAAADAGESAKALALAETVAPDGPYHERAAALARKARRSVAQQRVIAARRACRNSEWLTCHSAAVLALELDVKSTAAQALVEESERNLREQKTLFAPWVAATSGSSRTGNEFAARYPDPEVREAIARYAAGEIDTARNRLETFSARSGANAAAALLSKFDRAATSANALLGQSNPEGAIVQWQAALEADVALLPETHPSVPRDKVQQALASAALKAGDAAFGRGNYADALALWNGTLARVPSNLMLLTAIGKLETRAHGILQTLPKEAAEQDQASCATLLEILGMTRPGSVVHKSASERLGGCTEAPK